MVHLFFLSIRLSCAKLWGSECDWYKSLLWLYSRHTWYVL